MGTSRDDTCFAGHGGLRLGWLWLLVVFAFRRGAEVVVAFVRSRPARPVGARPVSPTCHHALSLRLLRSPVASLLVVPGDCVGPARLLFEARPALQFANRVVAARAMPPPFSTPLHPDGMYFLTSRFRSLSQSFRCPFPTL